MQTWKNAEYRDILKYRHRILNRLLKNTEDRYRLQIPTLTHGSVVTLTHGSVVTLTHGSVVTTLTHGSVVTTLTHGSVVTLTHGSVVTLTHGSVVMITACGRCLDICCLPVSDNLDGRHSQYRARSP